MVDQAEVERAATQLQAIAPKVIETVEKIGFFEEKAGVRSLSRVMLVPIMAVVAGLAVVVCIYVLTAKAPDSGVVASLAGFVTAVGGLGVFVHKNRDGGD